jgi:hypothetical protein
VTDSIEGVVNAPKLLHRGTFDLDHWFWSAKIDNLADCLGLAWIISLMTGEVLGF